MFDFCETVGWICVYRGLAEGVSVGGIVCSLLPPSGFFCFDSLEGMGNNCHNVESVI